MSSAFSAIMSVFSMWQIICIFAILSVQAPKHRRKDAFNISNSDNYRNFIW